jgi:Ca-activated chloride channel family protein
MLLLAWPAARAQTADDFFNGGAHFYISNSIPQALETVEGGLKQYPDDVKLKKLYELLKQQQQQQSQNNQSQQNQQNQSQQQKSNSQQNQQNSQPQQQDKQKQSAEEKAEQQKQQQQKSGEKQENKNEQGQPAAAGQMTPEEAKRLLDAQKGNEQFLQLKPQGKPKNQNQPIKDW